MITLNLARVNPIYFSNNVLECVRDRIHVDKFYNSFSLGLIRTVEGIAAFDSLLTFMSKIQKTTALKYNKKLHDFIDIE